MGVDKLDFDLIKIINQVSDVQKVLGVKEKPKENPLAVGPDGKIDRFIDLHGKMVDKLGVIKECLEKIRDFEKSPGQNPTDLIREQSKIRSEMQSINEDFKELDALYRKEANKRNSKISPDELKFRQLMVTKMQGEIQSIKEIQRMGYMKGYTSTGLVSMEQSELFQPLAEDEKLNRAAGGTRRGPDTMTDSNRLQLQRLRERDSIIDQEIENIGKSVDELGEIARTAHDEIVLQNQLIDSLGNRVEDVHEHVTNINTQMKVILEEARKSDKICMDICCIILLIGMIIVLVQLTKKK